MRSLTILMVLATLCLPGCTIVVERPDEACQDVATDGQQDAYRVSGNGYSTPYGGTGSATISWRGMPSSSPPRVLWGPNRREWLYATPMIVPGTCPDGGPNRRHRHRR